MSLCASLQEYFAANPAAENAPLGVTSANLGAKFNALSDARQAMHNGNMTGG
jgi:hypothetical protein